MQLLSRYWKITDAYGEVQEVLGDGVMGEQPYLRPQETYEYTSGVPLGTDNGFMSGYYIMQTANGHEFIVYVPDFSLDSPHRLSLVN